MIKIKINKLLSVKTLIIYILPGPVYIYVCQLYANYFPEFGLWLCPIVAVPGEPQATDFVFWWGIMKPKG